MSEMQVITEPEDSIVGGETTISDKSKEGINDSSEFQTELQNNGQQVNYINYICVSHILTTVDNSMQNTRKKEAKRFICNYCYKNYPKINLLKIHQSSKDCPHSRNNRDIEKKKESIQMDNSCSNNKDSIQMYNLDNSCANNKEPIQRIQIHKSASECQREKQVLWKNHHLCHICGVIAKNLFNHLRNHVKLHKCTLCDFRCSNRNELKIHMRVHTGKKPYKCDLCGKRFKTKCNMKLHVQTVHLKIPRKTRFTCGRCNRAFQSNRYLITHKCL